MTPSRPRRRRRLPHSRAVTGGWALFGIAVLVGGLVGLTAANSVATSRIGVTALSVTANDLRPAFCVSHGISVSVVTNGSSGTASGDLLLGTSGIDTMNGNGGNDCVVAGGGADTLEGGAGTDACMGGPGVDVLGLTCEHSLQD